MRIISGTAKGHRLTFPKNSKVRPATDKVKESIFNIIGPLDGLKVLDLFAGSGSIGLEAASRGAKLSVMVDDFPLCIKIIKQNIEKTKLHQSLVIKAKIPQQLDKLTKFAPFDLVFVDPPYDKDLVNISLDRLKTDKLIDAKTLIIIEHSPREEMITKGYHCFDQRKYGQTIISFLNLD